MPHPLAGVVDENNRWREETPGAEGWTRVARPGAPNKYFMVSADTHIVEPKTLWRERIAKDFVDRLPSHEVDKEGKRWTKQEGMRPAQLNLGENVGPEDKYREKAGGGVEARLLDQDYDGVDCEIIFPTIGLLAFSTRDPEFSLAQCEIYNDWVWETLKEHQDRMAPMALVPTASVEVGLRELARVAKTGFKGVMCPVTPLWGAEQHGELAYNLPDFDPFWAALEETGLPVTFHVGTGRDPRIASKHGGAVINLVWGSHSFSINTVVRMCSSGVFDRFPKLRFAMIESGVGWLPWVLDIMDQAYKKHHMWVRPKLKHGLPSDYFKAHGFASFEEDDTGMRLVEELGLENNLLWANDYPHYEGSWPHSAAAIERSMAHLKDETRGKILGENAARLFNLQRPAASARRGA